MKKIKNVLLCLSFISAAFIAAETQAQDTFSICAVDSITGEVGSAGATCIPSSSVSAIVISDVHPGIGVIHTQALVNQANQIYAGTLMDMGLSPQQILDSVTINDDWTDSTIRQYGVVDLNNGAPRSAAFTGVNCLNYKNHITGPGYSIQGNTLLGQQILDSMESKYLHTSGTLACKLMAALQGAKVAGADTRCLSIGISSFSAFIRVARPQDTTGTFILDLTVNTFHDSIEPIDTLQYVLDNHGGCNFTAVAEKPLTNNIAVNVFPNPAAEELYVIRYPLHQMELISIYDINGRKIYENKFRPEMNAMTINVRNIPAGIYSVIVHSVDYKISVSKKLVIQEK